MLIVAVALSITELRYNFFNGLFFFLNIDAFNSNIVYYVPKVI